MLEPHDRRDLIESLRPPAGYTLDFAVGTSYTLDLLTVLTTPLAFTFFNWEGNAQEEEPSNPGQPNSPIPNFRIDPLALFEAIRRYSDKLVIFCQTGQIKIPKGNPHFFSYLENSIYEVAPPNQHSVFHPKIWVLRYIPSSDSQEKHMPVQYRLICLSRNLTFDHTWDTILVLEGTLGETENKTNQPLQDFLRALPFMTRREIKDKTREKIEQLAEELKKVRFEEPEGFESIRFWPLGIKSDSPQWPFGGPERNYKSLLVVSPFLTEGCLNRLSRHSPKSNILISRPESLDKLGGKQCLGHFEKQYTLSFEAQLPEGENDFDQDEESVKQSENATMVGLHAKLFLAEEDEQVRLWTGSANATDAAFNGNVEFLVELGGKKNRVGINKLLPTLENKDAPGLMQLLEPYNSSQSNPELKDPFQTKLEQTLNKVCLNLSFLPLKASIVNNSGENAEEPLAGTHIETVLSNSITKVTTRLNPVKSYRVELFIVDNKYLSLDDGVTVRVWPITLQELSGSVMVTPERESKILATFKSVSLAAITSFFAFEVVVKGEDPLNSETKEIKNRFVLNLPLEGIPENRKEQLLKSLLTNSNDVIRFFLFLLAEGETLEARELIHIAEGLGVSPGLGRKNRKAEPPLFEIMVRSLRQNPEKLDQIAQLVIDLSKTSDGQLLLPPGFMEIWEPIWEARQRLGEVEN